MKQEARKSNGETECERKYIEICNFLVEIYASLQFNFTIIAILLLKLENSVESVYNTSGTVYLVDVQQSRNYCLQR